MALIVYYWDPVANVYRSPSGPDLPPPETDSPGYGETPYGDAPYGDDPQ